MAGFVVPAQPVKAPKRPVGTDWVHEIKHDGYRIIVRRDGPTVRLYSRNAYDWTARLAAIAAAAELIKAKTFTIDGEAVVLGPDGLSRFQELSGREAARTAILYAFDLIEHDGEDLRHRPFLDRKAALARLLRRTKAGILLNTSPMMGRPCSPMRASLAPRASSRRTSMARIDPARAASGSRSATRQHRGAARAERDLESVNKAQSDSSDGWFRGNSEACRSDLWHRDSALVMAVARVRTG
jgi:ATP dependent DNA ligase domain